MTDDRDTLIWANALGRAVKVRRTDMGLSRAELAERAGLSYPYVAEIENGKKSPSDRSLRAIADALELRTHELVAEAEARAEKLSMSDADLDPAYLAGTAPSFERRRWFGDASAAPSRVTRMREESWATPRSLSAVMSELEGYLSNMGAEDVDRILDLARRLGRS